MKEASDKDGCVIPLPHVQPGGRAGAFPTSLFDLVSTTSPASLPQGLSEPL